MYNRLGSCTRLDCAVPMTPLGSHTMVKERTLKQTWDAVDTQLQHYFDAAYLDPDKVFFDIGKETVGS